MKASSTGEGPRVVINMDALNALRKANGIDTDVELSRRLGVSPVTLWRVTTGLSTPSSEFIARALTAFPQTQFGVLFAVEQKVAA